MRFSFIGDESFLLLQRWQLEKIERVDKIDVTYKTPFLFKNSSRQFETCPNRACQKENDALSLLFFYRRKKGLVPMVKNIEGVNILSTNS